jgi:hypothetical protein
MAARARGRGNGHGVDGAVLETSLGSTGALLEAATREAGRRKTKVGVSPLGPASGTQSNHRGHCPSTVPADLVDPTPGSSLRRTGPSHHQTIEAKAHCENDPATPKPRLSDRTTDSSTPEFSTKARAVIFDPAADGRTTSGKYWQNRRLASGDEDERPKSTPGPGCNLLADSVYKFVGLPH